MSFKKGVVFGAWDLLHAGHVLMLNIATTECDRLIIGLHVDPSLEDKTKNKPVQSLFERYIQLIPFSFGKCEIEIIPYEREEEVRKMLSVLNVDIRYLGDDYRDSKKPITGLDICVKRGIVLYYVSRSHGFSSSDLRKRIKES